MLPGKLYHYKVLLGDLQAVTLPTLSFVYILYNFRDGNGLVRLP